MSELLNEQENKGLLDTLSEKLKEILHLVDDEEGYDDLFKSAFSSHDNLEGISSHDFLKKYLVQIDEQRNGIQGFLIPISIYNDRGNPDCTVSESIYRVTRDDEMDHYNLKQALKEVPIGCFWGGETTHKMVIYIGYYNEEITILEPLKGGWLEEGNKIEYSM